MSTAVAIIVSKKASPQSGEPSLFPIFGSKLLRMTIIWMVKDKLSLMITSATMNELYDDKLAKPNNGSLDVLISSEYGSLIWGVR